MIQTTLARPVANNLVLRSGLAAERKKLDRLALLPTHLCTQARNLTGPLSREFGTSRHAICAVSQGGLRLLSLLSWPKRHDASGFVNETRIAPLIE